MSIDPAAARRHRIPRWRLWTLLWGSDVKYLSLRRGLVVLLVGALMPITVLSIVQGLVRLEARRAAAIQQLSENATALASSNQAILGSTEMLLQVTALNPLVRGGGAPCASVFAAIRATTSAYANLSAYDADGRLTCAAIAPPGPYVVTDPQWRQKLGASPRALVSDAVWGTFSGRRVVTMTLPLRRPDGSFDGALAAAIDLAWLNDRLRAQIGASDTGVAIISDSGQVLMASRALPEFDIETQPGTVARVAGAGDTRWSYTVVPLVLARGGQQGLHVVYASPEPPRFGFIWWQTIVDFALPVAAILLASLAIWIGAQRLVLRWLLSLQRLALHFAGGDYRQRPVSFSQAPREIRSVAASLYRMSSAVSERDRRLRESLDHQRLLAREVHHRVKNNFQVVMSLLSLQSSRLADENAKRAIDQARRRIGALALVHRLLYDTGEIANISSRALLGALCEQLQPPVVPGRQLDLECDFDDVPLDIDNAVPLTLWLVETVNNAFHHGFPGLGSGSVRAEFRVDGEAATLTITDNGVGFDTVSPPADRAGGHGLRLIKALAMQLGGTADVTVRDGGGSIATLRFRLRAPVAALEPLER